MSVARDCRDMERWKAGSRSSGVDREYVVGKDGLTSKAGSFRHTIGHRSRKIYEGGRRNERGQRRRP